MVVLYGERVMCNVTNEEGQETPITVTEYIVNDLKEDELAFHNPLHRQILTEAAERIHNEGFTAERYFVAHPDPVISKLSVELISNRYQLRKSQIEQMVTDEERLYELIPRLMINFKYALQRIEQSKKHHGKAAGRQSHPEFLNSIRGVLRQELCLIKFINSSRVFAWLNAPVKSDVVVMEFCFSTPRICMHMCLASTTTITPSGFSVS